MSRHRSIGAKVPTSTALPVELDGLASLPRSNRIGTTKMQFPAIAQSHAGPLKILLTSLVVAGVSSWPAIAHTDMQVELTCPYDGTKFTAQLQGSGTSFATLLDFRPIGAIVTPWLLAICPTNGFVFYKNKFEVGELETLKPFVLSNEYQSMKDETPYFRAAWLMERAGFPHTKVTWEPHQATWETYEPRERYIRYAKAVLSRLPEDIEAAKGAEKTNLRILRGELLRRIEKFGEAAEELRSLKDELDPASVEAKIVNYEIELSGHGDYKAHLSCEAMGGSEQIDKQCQNLGDAIKQVQEKR